MTSVSSTPPTSTPPSPASSTDSPSSDPTTPAGSSSPPAARTTSTATAGSASSGLRYEDRIFLTGATRTGKSHLARRLFLSAASPRLVIDPADSSLTAVPGAVTFSDPARATNAAGESWTTAATARFVPTDPDDLDAYNQVYAWAFARFPRWVWCDEVGQVLPARGYPRAGNRYLVQGAKRRLGHLGCHTRPRECAPNLISQAQFVGIFDLPNPDDVAHVANLVGIRPAQLAAAMGQLGQYEFLWWSQRERRLLHLPALR